MITTSSLPVSVLALALGCVGITPPWCPSQHTSELQSLQMPGTRGQAPCPAGAQHQAGGAPCAELTRSRGTPPGIWYVSGNAI